MKTKPNFTYKEFIEKISNVQISNKDSTKNKSPRALKSQNKNFTNTYANYQDKQFQKRTTQKQQSLSRTMTSKLSPRKIQAKQNVLESTIKNQPSQVANLKSTTNKKLKLKNQSNFVQEYSQGSSLNHSKSIRQQQRGNFYHNQSSFVDQRHNESCSTFFKNYPFENQEECFHNNSVSLGKSPPVTSRLPNKKLSSSSIDGKLKIVGKGNQTERDTNRLNTQYYEDTKRPERRLNTQYERTNSKTDRLSPSFYKLSVDQSSFLEFEDDRGHRNLFPESCKSRSKRSTISLCSQEQKVKLNDKSYEHVYNKFISKISQTLFQITKIDNQGKLLEHKIKYIEFLECLKELKMIRSDYEPYSQTEEVDLVKELWEELIMGHNINHFIIIVALILKITPLQNIKPDNSPELQNYIYIQKKYEQFRFARLQLDKSKIYSQKQSIQYYNFPFKPTISKASEEMASQPRSQKKYKINASVSHNQSIQLNSRRQNTSINTEFENVNQTIFSPSKRSTSPLGNKRSELLYNQGRKKSLQKRQNKSTVDYEYERNKEQLTFKPKITLKKKKPKTDEPTQDYFSPRFALDEQKMINRLIRGRVQKEVKQLTINKGLPYNDKMIDKLRRQKFEQVIKSQQESRLKTCQNQSKFKLKTSQIHNLSRHQKSTTSQIRQDNNNGAHNRCTTQVQQLQSIHNLSFQDYSMNQNQKINQNDEEGSAKKIQNSPLRAPTYSNSQNLEQSQEHQEIADSTTHQLEDYFALDIYFEQNRSEKLMIRRDSSYQELISEAENFVKKHNLPSQMGNKLKQQLMIAMRFHDIEKIEENAEEEECSLIG